MNTYLIEPLAPLVFRSGRPFGAGSRDGALFPWPSSLAGVLRTAVMDERGWPAHGLDDVQQRALLETVVAGPILARRQGGGITPMLPKPADALYLLPEEGGRPEVYRLLPGQYPEGCGSDLPAGLQPLLLEGGAPKGKAQKGPEFWPLEQLLAWRRGERVAFAGLPAEQPLPETRTHVAIDRVRLAADSGRLFQVAGLDFGSQRHSGGYAAHDWVLLARCDARLGAQAVALGGERRLSWLSEVGQDPLQPPQAHLHALREAAGLSLTLVTPALFQDGWKPAWLTAGAHGLEGEVPGVPGLRLRLRAAAVERWQGVSGWDLRRQRPKLARKAVAAGATYWFEFVAPPPPGWAQALWLAPLADDPQDRHDGFGLALPGPWDARPITL